jgi:FkbM family methyltransferase
MADWVARIKELCGVPIKGVVHIGANGGIEYDCYAAHGIERQVWVEPQPEPYGRLLARLPKSPGIYTFKVACGSRNGSATMTLLRGNAGESNSILKPKTHLIHHPQFPVDGELDVQLTRLDDLFAGDGLEPSDYNFLVADVQGYELEVLKGAETVIDALDYVQLEVNTEELYESCPLIADLDDWLRPRGFERKITDLWGPSQAYGDAVYVRQCTLKGQVLKPSTVNPKESS